MIGIERRAKRDLFCYLFIDPVRYVSLEHYRPLAGGFSQTVREGLGDDWQVQGETGIWCHCVPRNDRTPDQGFKIHVSATFDNALRILKAVVPILVRHQVVFKCLTDARVLDFVNSQAFSRSACGKFITIYPNGMEQFKVLLEELHAATSDYAGPYILSDRRYPPSKVLFYRYGAFRNINRLNIFGEMEACLRGGDGELVLDERRPYFTLPDNVQDPFEDKNAAAEEPLLNRRYAVKGLVGTGASSKGGVYLGEDTRSGREVIIKEARPLINRSRDNPHDAVACLQHEYNILKLLENSGYTPQPLEIFCEWEHWFLTMEKAAGVPLSSFRAYEAFSIMLKTCYTDAELRNYCREFLRIAENLLAAVRAIHERGVVVQDLAPQNILINPDDGKVTLLDFESAYHVAGGENSPLIPLGTIGYTPPRNRDTKPQFADDYYALSSVLYDLLFPVSLMFPLNPKAKATLLQYIGREKGIPQALVQFILCLPEQPERAQELLATAQCASEATCVPAKLPPQSTAAILDQAVAQIIAYIEAQLQLADHSGLLPTDYRRYATNPLSVAYGYCGIAQFLRDASHHIPQRLEKEILEQSRNIQGGDYAPGLYIGSSGIAWVMENLGWRDEAERIMKLSANSVLLHENADLFYGTAGWGLTNLFFFHRTGSEEYLNHARLAADGISERLQLAGNGLFYENFGDAIFYGYAHGASGIALFFLRLYQVTRNERDLDIARRLLDYDIAAASERDQQLIWPRSNKHMFMFSPYQRIGSAGIGSVLQRFHAITGDSHYLDVAKRATTYLVGKLTVFPGQFSGMAGIGELFVDLHQHTGEEHYRDEALRFADRILLFGVERSEGLVFPGDETVRVSTDFATGSAGIGMFLRRLANGGPRTFYDF